VSIEFINILATVIHVGVKHRAVNKEQGHVKGTLRIMNPKKSFFKSANVGYLKS
jgi:hypothetical protein